MSLKKFIASLIVAISALTGAAFATAPPAFAGDNCDVCIDDWQPPGCDSPTAHNWKLCDGEATGGEVDDIAVTLALPGSDLFGDGDDESSSSTLDDEKHNWKRDGDNRAGKG